MTSSSAHFRPALFSFLRDLAAHNDRDWFKANRERYDSKVLEPAQQFISEFGPRLKKISPHFNADPRPIGGSIFRIYRDTRFSKDKTPYKTHTGIHFRHEAGKDAYTPGFYLHLDPAGVFVGMGIWHPDSSTLKKIRAAIAENPARWKRLKNGKRFRETFELAGDSLKRAPKGYDPDHPLIDDLRRKDFIAVTNLTQKDVTSPGFLDQYTDLCKAGSPLVKFLCEAVEVDY